MKILVIQSSNPFNRASASSNRFLTLVEGLHQAGCQIHLVFSDCIYSISEFDNHGYSGINNGITYQYLIPIYCKNIIQKLYQKILYPNWRLSKKIINIIDQGQYDFVWLGTSTRVVNLSLHYIFKSSKLKDIKFFHERSEYSWIGLGKKKYAHNKYLKKFLFQLDYMIVMTKSLEKYYQKYLNPAASIIHLPMTVDFSRFDNLKETNITFNKPYIAYCGALSNKKDGVDILIQSFLQLKDDFPDLHLYIAGSHNPKNDFIQQKEIIEKANAENRVTYLGLLSRDDIPIFLSNAKVLALARPESKQAEGGFPTKLGEYLATGNPVCVTKVGEIENYLNDGESAYLAEPNSIDSFVSCLKTALIDTNASNVGQKGRNVAYKFFNKDIQSKLLYNFLETKFNNKNNL